MRGSYWGKNHNKLGHSRKLRSSKKKKTPSDRCLIYCLLCGVNHFI